MIQVWKIVVWRAQNQPKTCPKNDGSTLSIYDDHK